MHILTCAEQFRDIQNKYLDDLIENEFEESLNFSNEFPNEEIRDHPIK